jgi:hypothetical protein
MDVVGIAEGIATRMLATAGVNLEWRLARFPSRPDAGRVIMIDFESNSRADLSPSVLAYALAFERVHIVVLYNRIRSLSRDNPVSRPTILAHVLTHEIVHVLQGLARHSASGVMKARWDAGDYLDMMRAPLPFTSEDIELIHQGCCHY